ncbi:MAG: hypothetical protein IJ562_12485 [Prevotella sp.]|nr:hypothetical protein [Prevotella sp.]
MKKLLFALAVLAFAFSSCGSKSGGIASSEESNSSGLADGKWPAAIYDQYGIPEIQTNGKITYTELTNEGSKQYEVNYKGVTKEEVQAWVNSLKEKGFRISDRDQEILDKNSWEHITLYQPGEQKDYRLGIFFNFKGNETVDYYADEPNPAFEVITKEDEDGNTISYIEYNFTVSLNPIDNKTKVEGAYEDLGVKAEELSGIPNVRTVSAGKGMMGGSIGFGFYSDHQLTKEDFDAVHNKLADVLAAKGLKFYHAMSEKELTAEQLKADAIRTYIIEKDGKKYMMMNHTESRVGDFGGGVSLMISPMKR